MGRDIEPVKISDEDRRVYRDKLRRSRDALGRMLREDQDGADRLLGIIEQRCRTGQTGAAWQIGTVTALSRRGAGRQRALALMTERSIEHMHANEPVHSWPVGA
jgi:hypothetical protein